MHTVFSITMNGSCKQYLKKKATKEETSIVRAMTLIMRTPLFKKKLGKEKTWIRALESTIEEMSKKK